MAPYRLKRRLTRTYSRAINEDDCMARDLLIEADLSGWPQSTIEHGD
jgi:hypothetical protein